MKIEVKDILTAAYYIWGENCDSRILMDSEDVSVKQESMPKGTQEKLHFHAKTSNFSSF